MSLAEDSHGRNDRFILQISGYPGGDALVGMFGVPWPLNGTQNGKFQDLPKRARFPMSLAENLNPKP